MNPDSDILEILGTPPHVKCWSVAGIPRFIPAVLGRWQRNRGGLPHRFVMILCPQAEINASGGLPDEVRKLTDPRWRLQHFTGCHRPYLALIHTGEDPEEWRGKIQPMLAWSEGYLVEISEETIRLQFIGAVEERDGF